MAKTVLLTGASTGIGKEAAIYFAKKGWNVAATMRTPSKETELIKFPNVKLYALDVTKTESIVEAIDLAIKDFGGIDVVVNNAGYGAVGIFEAATAEQIQKQFETNVFGVMNVIREILPHFRQKRNGTIVNITSVGGRIAFPVYSVYHATKWAVEGFSESLSFELKPFNIKIKCVEPGAIKTDFYNRSQDLFKKEGLTAYDSYANITLANTQKAGEDAPGPLVVAETIYKAATSNNFKLRYPTGMQAAALLMVRKIFPNSWFRGIIGSVVEKGVK
jgi:NAD(P)-dependent dehydrogenase (short-subunit alcohol dehydrogenase family)